MSEGPSANRRWFRFAFSLRTLLVAATILGIFLGWLGSEWRFIVARQACEARLPSHAAHRAEGESPFPAYLVMNGPPGNWREQIGTPSIPFWRRWFGDVPFALVYVPAAWPEQEFERTKALFPEAYVFWRREYLHRSQSRWIKGSGDRRWIRSVEHELGVAIPDEHAAQIKTVDDALRYAELRPAVSSRNLDESQASR